MGAPSLPAGSALPQKSWHVGFGSIAALFLAIALGTFLYSGYLLLNRMQIDDSVTIEDELRAGNQLIDQLTNAELIETYYDISQAGLGQRSTPPAWYAQKLWAEYFEDRAIKFGIAFIISLALGLVFLWLSNRGRVPRA